jgi:hypothetical protein
VPWRFTLSHPESAAARLCTWQLARRAAIDWTTIERRRCTLDKLHGEHQLETCRRRQLAPVSSLGSLAARSRHAIAELSRHPWQQPMVSSGRRPSTSRTKYSRCRCRPTCRPLSNASTRRSPQYAISAPAPRPPQRAAPRQHEQSLAGIPRCPCRTTCGTLLKGSTRQLRHQPNPRPAGDPSATQSIRGDRSRPGPRPTPSKGSVGAAAGCK